MSNAQQDISVTHNDLREAFDAITIDRVLMKNSLQRIAALAQTFRHNIVQ